MDQLHEVRLYFLCATHMPDFGEASIGTPEGGIFGNYRLHATNGLVPLALTSQFPGFGVPRHLRMRRRLGETSAKQK